MQAEQVARRFFRTGVIYRPTSAVEDLLDHAAKSNEKTTLCGKTADEDLLSGYHDVLMQVINCDKCKKIISSRGENMERIVE